MEFKVGEQPGQVTMDYVQTGQVRGERQVAAFLDRQMEAGEGAVRLRPTHGIQWGGPLWW